MEKDKQVKSSRAGRYVGQSSGYSAFMPQPLPPNPPIKYDDEMQYLLSLADTALGRLDGSMDLVPDIDFFVYMYVSRESVLSSQIEGTRASLIDELELEAGLPVSSGSTDADEIRNYIEAMNYGLKRLEELPLCLRLLREIHEKLLAGVRGHNRSPGQFRKSQNWIGPEGSTIETAAYIPPCVEYMNESLGNLEKFLHSVEFMPILIRTGLIHAQFETIHPFLDGNGRVGRLLITLFLCQQKVLKRPLLYISHYFKQNQSQYYDMLQAVRKQQDGWEKWLKYFLRGVYIVAQESAKTGAGIISLRERHRQIVSKNLKTKSNLGLQLLEKLYRNPVVSPKTAAALLGAAQATTNALLNDFVELGILTEQTGKKRNRIYIYRDYVQMFMD